MNKITLILSFILSIFFNVSSFSQSITILPVSNVRAEGETQVAIVKNAGVDVGYMIFHADRRPVGAGNQVYLLANYYNLSNTQIGTSMEPLGGGNSSEYDNANDWQLVTDNNFGMAASFEQGSKDATGFYTVNTSTGAITEVLNETAASGISGLNGSATVGILNNGNLIFVYANAYSLTAGEISFDIINPNTGSAIVSAIAVTTTASNPTVTALPDGGFFVAYAIGSGTPFSTKGKRYDASGNLVGNEVTIFNGTATVSNTTETILSNGYVLIQESGKAKIYDFSGGSTPVQVGGEINILPGDFPKEENVGVKAFKNGGFVAAYVASDNVVFQNLAYRIFDNNGNPATSGQIDITSRSNTDRIVITPDLATFSDGSFVVSFGNDNASTGGYSKLERAIVKNMYPVIDLDSDNSSGGTGTAYTAATLNGQSGGVAVVDSDVFITDADGEDINSIKIEITNHLDGANEFLTLTNATGISISGSGTKTLTLTSTGLATKANFQNALASVKYENTVATNTTNRSVLITVTDKDALAANATATVAITAASSGTVLSPTVSTTAASSISSTSVTLAGNATSDGGASITERGYVYAITSTNNNPEISGAGVTKITDGTGTGIFSESISSLASGTQYSFKAYATNSVDTTYGSVQTFTTTITNVLLATNPTINFNVPTSTTLSATITDGQYGATGISDATINMYTANSGGVANNKVFKYFDNPLNGGVVGDNVSGDPMFVIAEASGNEFSFNGIELTEWGGGAYTLKIEGFKNGSSTGSVTASVGVDFIENFTSTTLTPFIFQDVDKVQITNNAGGVQYLFYDKISVGSPVTNTTPTVSTTAASSIAVSSATLAGNATSDGGASITERGYVYAITGTNNDPEISGTGVTKIIDGTGTGVFSGSVSSLTGSTQYSFKAYATNSVGTTYGIVETFTTATPASTPTVSTSAASVVTTVSVDMAGDATADGGASITEKGYVYAVTTTNSNPEIGGTGVTKKTDGIETGAFSETVASLTSNTQYSYKAYATNSVGTSYGSVQIFTTEVSGISNFAGLGGDNTGGAGFKTNTSNTNYVVSNIMAQDGDGTSIYIGDNTVGVTQTYTIKADGINAESFSVNVLNVKNFADQIFDQTSTVVFKDKSGATIQTMTLNADKVLPKNSHSIFSFFDNGTTSPVNLVSEIIFTLVPNTGAESVENWTATDITISNIIAPSTAPTVTTADASSVDTTSATLAGDVTADGGETVTERGIVYAITSTNNNPEVGGTGVTKDDNGSGIGTFSEPITGFTASTQYSYAAYAINNQGTSYGTVKTFITSALSVETEILEKSVHVYPNPVEDALYIDVDDNLQVEDIKVYDVSGKLLKTLILTNKKINLSDFFSGSYFIKIKTNQGNLTKLIVKK